MVELLSPIIDVAPVRVLPEQRQAPWSLQAVADLDYSPALLLPAPWLPDAAFVHEADYALACHDGFACYQDSLSHWNRLGTHFILVEPVYTWAQLVEFVTLDVAARPSSQAALHDAPTPLAWRAGFLLGWLSAHALRHSREALHALRLLAVLVEAEGQGCLLDYPAHELCHRLRALP